MINIGGGASRFLSGFGWYAFPVGGAFAGAICGMNRPRLIAAAAGMMAGLAINVSLNANDLVFTIGPLTAVSLPALGVIVGKVLHL